MNWVKLIVVQMIASVSRCAVTAGWKRHSGSEKKMTHMALEMSEACLNKQNMKDVTLRHK